jgi:antitoxin component YwqK of YwqJK toxin-antitoxin module
MKNILSILLVSIILMGCVPRDGLQRGWYENGQTKWEQNYKDGKRID